MNPGLENRIPWAREEIGAAHANIVPSILTPFWSLNADEDAQENCNLTWFVLKEACVYAR